MISSKAVFTETEFKTVYVCLTWLVPSFFKAVFTEADFKTVYVCLTWLVSFRFFKAVFFKAVFT